MRAKKWAAVALAVAIAGAGTGALAHAMTQQQEAVMAKTVKVSEKESPSQKEGKKGEEKASYPVQTIEPSENAIKNEQEITKTEADMSAEQAAQAAVKKANDVFGKLEVKKIIDLHLSEYHIEKCNMKADEAKGRETHTARVYTGLILCKGGAAYEFCVDAITGEEMYWMEQLMNYTEKGYGNSKHDDKIIEKIWNNEQKYFDAAKLFYKEHLQQKGQSNLSVDFELLPGGSQGDVKGIHWERHIASVLCCVDNQEYNIILNPENAKIIGWRLEAVK